MSTTPHEIFHRSNAPVTIDEDKCIADKGCTVCVDVCPLDLLAIDMSKGQGLYAVRRMLVLHAVRTGLPDRRGEGGHSLPAALKRMGADASGSRHEPPGALTRTQASHP